MLGASAGYWLLHERRGRASDSAVFQPTLNEPTVSESGMAYCMIDVGSNVVKLVASAS